MMQFDRRTIVDAVVASSGAGRSWPSIARIAAWAAAWLVAIGLVISPAEPDHRQRSVEADVPPSRVRYVAPTSRSDTAGFLPPAHDPSSFTVAWIGGSEIKLREVSVPGAVENRIATVGGRPLLIDSYNLIAPRLIDMLRAVDTAIASDADAIVIAINPAWGRAEWSLRGWDNLDVSNLASLWERPATWSWALALTSPDDYAWRAGRAAFAVVEAQVQANARLLDWRQRLNPLPDAPSSSDTGDPRLPPDSSLWLVEHYGTAVMQNEDLRVASLMRGTGVTDAEARFFVDLLIDSVEDAGVPAFLYGPSFAPESLATPYFADEAAAIEAYWADVATSIDSPLVALEPRSLSRDYDSTGTFANTVHMVDTSGFGSLLAERLCRHWTTIDPTMECG